MGLDMYLSRKETNKDTISKELCYWRKANQIHKWFVDNGIQKSEREWMITKMKLKELLDLCKQVQQKAILVNGKIKNGYTYKDGVQEPIIQDGKIIKNHKEIAELLPTQSVFFFESTNYDEYYMSDIIYTIGQLEHILEEDKDKDVMYIYEASW